MRQTTTANLLLILISLFGIYSCTSSNEPYTVKAYGNLGELVVFTDKETYKHPIMNTADKNSISTVEKVFEATQPYYITSEPYFIVIKREFGGIAQAAKTFTNVLVLANAENKDKLVGYISPLKLNIDSLANSELPIVIKRNVWSEPQTVVFLFGKTAEDLQNKLVNYGPTLIKKFLETEKANLAERTMNKDTVKNIVAKTTDRLFHFTMGLPTIKIKDYRLANSNDTFAWFKFEAVAGRKGNEYMMNLAVMTRPYTNNSQFSLESINSFIDSAVKYNIPGPLDSMYMEIDDRVDPTVDTISMNGAFTIRSKAWWHYGVGIGGGPITSYTFFHEKTGNLVTCIGFILGPSVEKTKYMRELEMCIESVNPKE